LVKVRGHLEHSNQCGDSMVVGFEFFIQDADAIPQLGVFYVFKTVKGMLISIEGLVDIF